MAQNVKKGRKTSEKGDWMLSKANTKSRNNQINAPVAPVPSRLRCIPRMEFPVQFTVSNSNHGWLQAATEPEGEAKISHWLVNKKRKR